MYTVRSGLAEDVRAKAAAVLKERRRRRRSRGKNLPNKYRERTALLSLFEEEEENEKRNAL